MVAAGDLEISDSAVEVSSHCDEILAAFVQHIESVIAKPLNCACLVIDVLVKETAVEVESGDAAFVGKDFDLIVCQISR